jgi:hypothetical protein
LSGPLKFERDLVVGWPHFLVSTSGKLQGSRVRVYWHVWLGILALTFLLRFTVLGGFGDDRGFSLSVVYMLATWLPIMVLNMMESSRLMAYLKKHHYKKWEDLTYIPWLGKNGSNGFRTLPWLYSPDDLGDQELAALKEEHRKFIRWVMTVFLSYLVIFPLLCI